MRCWKKSSNVHLTSIMPCGVYILPKPTHNFWSLRYNGDENCYPEMTTNMLNRELSNVFTTYSKCITSFWMALDVCTWEVSFDEVFCPPSVSSVLFKEQLINSFGGERWSTAQVFPHTRENWKMKLIPSKQGKITQGSKKKHSKT